MKSFIGFLFVAYCVLSVVSLFGGFLNKVSPGPGENCNPPHTHMAYIVPSYLLGCWLGGTE